MEEMKQTIEFDERAPVARVWEAPLLIPLDIADAQATVTGTSGADGLTDCS
jgi:hypothetical protein